MAQYLMNESKHLDLMGWLDTIENLGVDIQATFPRVDEMNTRAGRILGLQSDARASRPDMTIAARRTGIHDDLTDQDAVTAAADQAAYGMDSDHHERTIEFYNLAADAAQGEALRHFRRTDILDALQPSFEQLAQRIIDAARTIPAGVLNLEDAARLGHSDAYQQLERDIETWAEISGLISELIDAGVITSPIARYPIEFMVDDPDAYREASAGSSRPLRKAQGIAAGAPRLHAPEGPPLSPADDVNTRLASYDANQDDKAAREALGLSR